MNPYSGGDDFGTFMQDVDAINRGLDQYAANINNIQAAHQQLLNEVSEDQEELLTKKLDSLVATTSALAGSLKTQIKQAQGEGQNDKAKYAQAEAVKNRFLGLIQDYRKVEADYRAQSKQRAERQYRIIRPEASDSEVQDAIEDASGSQLFSQALLNANRRGEARSALNEVQSRHRELQKLEKTMGELNQLFHDMEELVAEQEAPIQEVDEQVEAAQGDIEQGTGHTSKAVVSARKARRKKCWCFWILVLIICIIIAAVVGGVVGSRN